MAIVDRNLIGTTGFIAITGAEYQHVWYCPQGWNCFHWLVGWAIFANTN